MEAPRPCGIVVIGRNEGERLERSLASVRDHPGPLVYVDSGSGDHSVAIATAAGADVVELTRDRPFSAARARNTGLQRILALQPDLEAVQFLDGDCEVTGGWLATGAATLAADGPVAAVCGFCTELHRDATIYNRLCDMEWDRRTGDIDATGGNAMLRVDALRQVGGFDETMIAGEEPDLCRRLREAGWRIRRLPASMVRHDAAMSSFAQWWTRARRSGYVDAMSVARLGRGAPRLRSLLSTLFWGLLLPVAGTGATVAGGVLLGPGGAAAAALSWAAAYGALFARIVRSERRDGRSPGDATLGARFLILGKLPQLQGALVYLVRRLRGGDHDRLIEYRGDAGAWSRLTGLRPRDNRVRPAGKGPESLP